MWNFMNKKTVRIVHSGRSINEETENKELKISQVSLLFSLLMNLNFVFRVCICHNYEVSVRYELLHCFYQPMYPTTFEKSLSRSGVLVSVFRKKWFHNINRGNWD